MGARLTTPSQLQPPLVLALRNYQVQHRASRSGLAFVFAAFLQCDTPASRLKHLTDALDQAPSRLEVLGFPTTGVA